MRVYLLLIFLIFVSSNISAQDGYKLIRKAEKEIKKENYSKALKLLDSAEKADYGWCGNSYYYAMGDIGILKSQIYNKQKHYDQSLEILESYFGCDFGVDCEKRDSLRIETLYLKFGKEKVIEEFINNLKVADINTIKRNDYVHYLVELPNFKYSFEIRYFDAFGFTKEELSSPNELVKNLPFYKLLVD